MTAHLATIKTINKLLNLKVMLKKLHLKSLLLLAVMLIGGGSFALADVTPTVLFHETFGNNTGSAREWNDSYSVKSGVASVYSGVTGYTVTNVKQGKNTTGSTQSGLNQSSQGTDATIIIGPLNVSDYNTLKLTYLWNAGSVKKTYSTSLYYKTSSEGDFVEVSGTGDGATTFVERAYDLPAAAQVSTLYLKIVWNTSNTQAIIDEVDLTGVTAVHVAVTDITLDQTTADIEVGGTVTLTPTITPANATNKKVTWESNDTDVATVSNDGVVTGVGAGTATITATTEENSEIKATCTVNVTAPVTPSITLSTKDVDVNAEENVGTITVGYYNFSDIVSEIVFFEADGTTRADANDYDWLVASINDESHNVDYVIAANTSESARSAYFKVYALDDEANEVYSDLITITQAGLDYAALPFSWAGGVSSGLNALAGVTTSGLGSNYADTHEAYRVKLDDTGDYIQIKTNAQPGKVTIGVKMIGGANASSITVKASADGESYRDIQTLSISGAQNTVLTLATTKAFAPTDRFVRLVFTKGSNVGVGPITIVGCTQVTVSEAGFATFCSANALDFSDTVEGVTAYTASLSVDYKYVSFGKIDTTIPAETGILLNASPGTYYLPFAISSDPDDVSGNKLVGVTSDFVIDGTDPNNAFYVLKKKGENVGFYKVTSKTYTVRANTAYLALPAGAGSAKEFIGLDGETAVEAVAAEVLPTGTAYNLQGQRVSNGYKGVVIVNGKKVIR